MVIRRQQMRSFEEACSQGFENRMIERLHTYFPRLGEQAGEPQC
jgi:hypothetical protein